MTVLEEIQKEKLELAKIELGLLNTKILSLLEHKEKLIKDIHSTELYIAKLEGIRETQELKKSKKIK